MWMSTTLPPSLLAHGEYYVSQTSENGKFYQWCNPDPLFPMERYCEIPITCYPSVGSRVLTAFSLLDLAAQGTQDVQVTATDLKKNGHNSSKFSLKLKTFGDAVVHALRVVWMVI